MTTSTDHTQFLRALSNQMADAVERVSPAIVQVNGRQQRPASGVVYAPDLVLTASHVLERDVDLTIQTADKRTLPAQLVGRDQTTDLAVLRVANLSVAAADATEENVRIGQLVIAVGRSNEEGPMASSGIVSAIGGPLRSGRGGIILERYIRTDAIPYPGFSGGPLVDTQGKVIGILTTGLMNNVTLAIPMTIAKKVADTLTNHGYVKRGYLGISSQLVQVPQAQRAGREQEVGLLIVRVDDNSPAQQGGVMLGDILVAIDGHAIKDAEDLQLLLTGERVGKAVPVDVIRGNELQTLQVTIGQRK